MFLEPLSGDPEYDFQTYLNQSAFQEGDITVVALFGKTTVAENNDTSPACCAGKRRLYFLQCRRPFS